MPALQDAQPADAGQLAAPDLYPHSDEGPTAKKRFAFRQAMLTRLNGMESIFQRLQSGKNIGTKGADRTRIRDKAAHESIISIALMSMTAAALTDQRAQGGTAYPVLPSQSPLPVPMSGVSLAPSSNGSRRSGGHRANGGGGRRGSHRSAVRSAQAARAGGGATTWDEAIAMLPDGVAQL